MQYGWEPPALSACVAVPFCLGCSALSPGFTCYLSASFFEVEPQKVWVKQLDKDKVNHSSCLYKKSKLAARH